MAEEARAHQRKMDALRETYRGHGDEGLAAWAAGRRAEPPTDAVATDRRLFGGAQWPCVWKGGVAHVACQVCGAFETLDRRLSGRIERLSSVGVDPLTPIAERACTWLDRGEPHWKRKRLLNTRDANGLRSLFSDDLRAYGEALNAITRQVRSQLPHAETEIERLQRSQAITAERLTVLETQLSRIVSFDRLGTPIGDMPIGLGQVDRAALPRRHGARLCGSGQQRRAAGLSTLGLGQALPEAGQRYGGDGQPARLGDRPALA